MERLGIRIGARTKRFLEDWTRAQDISTSKAVRCLIQRQLGPDIRSYRKERPAG